MGFMFTAAAGQRLACGQEAMHLHLTPICINRSHEGTCPPPSPRGLPP